jgi:hypothetical protein
VNDLPSIQHISSTPILNIHAVDSLENPLNFDTQEKHNGFFVLSNDGKIYRVKFQSILTEKKHHEQKTILPCFPQYVKISIDQRNELCIVYIREQSKDTSKIVRMIFFNCNPSNLVSQNLIFKEISNSIFIHSF